MIPDTWSDDPEPTLTGPPADDDASADTDALFRPAWETEPDETDLLRPPPRRTWRTSLPSGEHGTGAGRDADALRDLSDLLVPLCAAQDALARLDARAAAAADAVRAGLIARMALADAAGWLAHTHAWVHPLDLALCDLGLTGSTAVAATGSFRRVLPHTFAGASPAGRAGWDEPSFDDMAQGDRAVADALALARSLRRLAGARAGAFATVAAAETTLAPFGAGPLDPELFARWRGKFAATPSAPPRRFSRGGEGPTPLPPLLLAADAAAAWMESGIADRPTPLHALLAAVALLGRGLPTGGVFAPVWAAYPAVGFGDRDALPGLRSDVVDRLVGRGRGVAWPVVFLHLVAESARAGLRELDRLTAAAETGRGLAAAVDKRARLPAAIDALLRVPALTPKTLAVRLRVAPQTATALLRELLAAGWAREVTGRGSYRAFAA